MIKATFSYKKNIFLNQLIFNYDMFNLIEKTED